MNQRLILPFCDQSSATFEGFSSLKRQNSNIERKRINTRTPSKG